MIDYHIHTHHSVDAEGTINEYCEQALLRGLHEICITNHCELDPLRDDNLIRLNSSTQPITNDTLLLLQDEVFKAKEYYEPQGLSVKFGLEVGYFEGIQKRLHQITKGLKVDFLMGSIHCLDHVCIDSSREYEIYFKKHDVSELLKKYFYTVEQLIQCQLFDALGHFDVYKKYGIRFYGEKIHIFPTELVSKIFHLMKEKKIALEINTAGLRRINEFYPAPQFMQCAYQQGLEMITIGSDSHKVTDLGKGIEQGIEYIKSFGFEAIYAFETRTPKRIEI